MAVSAVFDYPYNVIIDFIIKRNKTEVDIRFYKGKNEIDTSLVGGGVEDVVGIAFQIALWYITPRKSNILILDEPLKFLKGGILPYRGAKMIKMLSQKLNIQIIMVSHSDKLIKSADRIFEVININGISKVERIDNE